MVENAHALVCSNNCISSKIIPPTLHVGIEVRLYKESFQLVVPVLRFLDAAAQRVVVVVRGVFERTNLDEGMCPQLRANVSKIQHSIVDPTATVNVSLSRGYDGLPLYS